MDTNLDYVFLFAGRQRPVWYAHAQIQRLSEECECVSRELLAFDVWRGVMDKLSGDSIEVTRRVSTP